MYRQVIPEIQDLRRLDWSKVRHSSGTAGAAELMGCTRQNIQDLVRRGRMRPVITLRNNFLFLRSEL